MKKKMLFVLALAALVSGGAFAQRVGDTYKLGNDSYIVQSVQGETVTLKKAPSGKRYEVVTEPMLYWDDAKAAAEARGGYLATITSAAEQETIDSLLTSMGISRSTPNIWIGGYYEDSVWKWVTGEPMTYTNWAPNEPNANRSTYRMQLYRNRQWDDEARLSRKGYIIEWD